MWKPDCHLVKTSQYLHYVQCKSNTNDCKRLKLQCRRWENRSKWREQRKEIILYRLSLLPRINDRSVIMMLCWTLGYIFKVNSPIPAFQVQHVNAMVRDDVQVLVHPVIRHAFHGLRLKTFPYEFWLARVVLFDSRTNLFLLFKLLLFTKT